jgi:2-succinyl-5-enolpyruvyl-6-hydroxy-3-cyclohexene-1-carboxylate synthase
MKYSDEINIQLLISNLKNYSISSIVVSPGSANSNLIYSLQNDPFFSLYSVVDERAAVYVAIGLFKKTRKPIVVSCTGATASRNYVSALSEAFESRIPIISVTSTQDPILIGHNIAQVIDNSNLLFGVYKRRIELPTFSINDNNKKHYLNINLNDILSKLFYLNSGPIHINLITNYSPVFTSNFSTFPKINYIHSLHQLPDLNKKKIIIFLSSNTVLEKHEVEILDLFCEKFNSLVIADNTSSYNGKYGINPSLILSQPADFYNELVPDLFFHIGGISGDYSLFNIIRAPVYFFSNSEFLIDAYKYLHSHITLKFTESFAFYINNTLNENSLIYFNLWISKLAYLYSNFPNIPFSNLLIAKFLSENIPNSSIIHLAILSSLRAWNYFQVFKSMLSSNVGGFGIDGALSTALGLSYFSKNHVFLIVGDLAFFYDINILFSKIPDKTKVTIILINNKKGVEFKRYNHQASNFGLETNPFIAADGHYSSLNDDLVLSLCTYLNFDYHEAIDIQSFKKAFDHVKNYSKNTIIECKIDEFDESKALFLVNNIFKTPIKKKLINKINSFLNKKNFKN